MKRIYQVKTPGHIDYFFKKEAAKEFRDNHPGSYVSIGPDHRNYKAGGVKSHIGTRGHKQGDSTGDGRKRTR